MIERPLYRDYLLSEATNMHEIAEELVFIIRNYFWQCSELAFNIAAFSPEHTLKKLFDFCKNYFIYYPENQYLQTSKTPSRIYHERYVDCKHYTIFVGSVLKCLGYPVSIKIIKYKERPEEDFDRTHVFVITKINDREIVFDCVESCLGLEVKNNVVYSKILDV